MLLSHLSAFARRTDQRPEPSNRGLHPLLVQDLKTVFDAFPLTAVQHLRANMHRLIRGKYVDDSGNGCIMYLLSEVLPHDRRIRRRSDLIRHFTGGVSLENRALSEYIAPYHVVQVWDLGPSFRYGGIADLGMDDLRQVIDDYLRDRLLSNDVHLRSTAAAPTAGSRRPDAVTGA